MTPDGISHHPRRRAAWLIELPERMDAEVNERAIGIAAAVERALLPDVTDVVVGYRSVMVYRRSAVPTPAVDALAAGRHRRRAVTLERDSRPLVDVPVCYGGEYGPDLGGPGGIRAAVRPKRSSSCTRRASIASSWSGSCPGFAYMAPVDPRIAAPRRTSPRLKVPAGSVAVAAGQTGVYPAETPGGWHLIGRTPVKPYDPARAEPFLFHPGDRVRFHRIDRRRVPANQRVGRRRMTQPDRGQARAC